MKKLLYIILLLPLWVNAQNVTMNKTNGYLRTLVSGTAVDSVMMSFGTGVNGYIPIYNSTLKKNVYTNPNTIIPTQYWQRSGTTLSPLTSGDNISTTGNIIGAAGSFASLSSVASNGIAANFSNNSTGFETQKLTQSGSGKIETFFNSGGEVASIGNDGGLTYVAATASTDAVWDGNKKLVSNSITGAGDGVRATSPTLTGTPLAPTATAGTNTMQIATTAFVANGIATAGNDYVKLTGNQSIAGEKTFTDYLTGVVNSSGTLGALLGNTNSAGFGVKIKGGSDATRYALTVNTADDMTTLFKVNGDGGVIAQSLTGSGDVITGANNSGQIGKITVGSGLSLTSGVLTATGGSSGSVTTSGGTAGKLTKFTSASNVENSIMAESSNSISVAGNMSASGSFSVDYAGSFLNTNTTAGTSNGLFVRGGTNSSDNGLVVNNAANTLTLLQVKGNGDAAIYGNITAANLTSGTYTPTLTNVTNISSSTPYVWQYKRQGSIVTLSGEVDFTMTATASTELGISLPPGLASNFSNIRNVTGTWSDATTSPVGGTAIPRADITNDRISVTLSGAAGVTRSVIYSLSYVIIP